MTSVRLAWRNVWRNRRRTIVTIAAATLALVTMIVYSGLVTGYLAGMERNILDLEVGDVQVFHPEYRRKPSLHSRVEDTPRLLQVLERAGFQAAPRLLGSGLIAAGDNSAGVSLRGVDVDRDRRVGKIHQQVEQGSWLEASDDEGVVLGRRLARVLGVSVGEEVVVLSQGADGSMANELYRVRGVLGSVGEEIDRGGMYMTEPAFRQLMVVPRGAHQIIVRKPAEMPLVLAGERVSALAPEYDAKTWRQLLPTLASMLDSTQGVMFAMFGIVYVSIGIVVLNAMLMAVFERIREFGVLKALGMGPGRVFGMVLLETAVQAVIAVAVALCLSIPANAYLAEVGIDLTRSMQDVTVGGMVMDPVWKSVVDIDTYVRPIVALCMIIALAVIYPAIRAAMIQPVTAMRHH